METKLVFLVARNSDLISDMLLKIGFKAIISVNSGEKCDDKLL